MKQPFVKKVKHTECVQVFRQHPEDATSVIVFLTEAFKNSVDAPGILSELHGDELSRILKSLGLPCYAGKRKKKQIDTLVKFGGYGKPWVVAFPDKVKTNTICISYNFASGS